MWKPSSLEDTVLSRAQFISSKKSSSNRLLDHKLSKLRKSCGMPVNMCTRFGTLFPQVSNKQDNMHGATVDSQSRPLTLRF